MLNLTRPQRKAVKRVFDRDIEGLTYRQFRSQVKAGWGCVMIQTPTGLWLGIELDGYTHS